MCTRRHLGTSPTTRRASTKARPSPTFSGRSAPRAGETVGSRAIRDTPEPASYGLRPTSRDHHPGSDPMTGTAPHAPVAVLAFALLAGCGRRPALRPPPRPPWPPPAGRRADDTPARRGVPGALRHCLRGRRRRPCSDSVRIVPAGWGRVAARRRRRHRRRVDRDHGLPPWCRALPLDKLPGPAVPAQAGGAAFTLGAAPGRSGDGCLSHPTDNRNTAQVAPRPTANRCTPNGDHEPGGSQLPADRPGIAAPTVTLDAGRAVTHLALSSPGAQPSTWRLRTLARGEGRRRGAPWSWCCGCPGARRGLGRDRQR